MTTEHSLLHSAFFYRSDREYLDSVVGLVSDWLSNADPVLVAVPGDKMASLRHPLGAAAGDLAGDLAMIDVTEAGRNPGRILGLMGAFLQRHPDRPVRIVGEPIWLGRTTIEYPAVVQHEALINLAFAEEDVTCMCLYDESRLDDDALADARVTHPLVWRDGAHQRSPQYAIDEALDRGNQPLPTHLAAVTYTVRRPAHLSHARRWSARYGRLLGMPDDRIADLQLIVTELATSSLQHRGVRCRLALWHHEGHLVCEARDTGQLADPLAGRRPPAADGSGASELFVVNAIADLVRIHTSPAGTTVRAYVRLGRLPEDAT
jgi:anti-sigma regulatory factor (Ser/Thr protein kinase)